jgi:hypothetical protein
MQLDLTLVLDRLLVVVGDKLTHLDPCPQFRLILDPRRLASLLTGALTESFRRDFAPGLVPVLTSLQDAGLGF